jgi:hypothetical protein
MDLNLLDLDDEYSEEEYYAAPAAPASAPADRDDAPSPLDEQAAMLKELAGMCMQVARLTFGRVMAAETAAAQAQARAEALPPSYVAPSYAAPSYIAPPHPAVAAEPAAPAAIPGLPADAHLAFHRASRAVRTSVALWRQLEREKDLGEARAAQARLDDRRHGSAGRRARIEAVVEEVAHDHFETALPGADNDYDALEAFRTVCGEVRERLDEEIYGDLAAAPVSEIVANICRDIGLSPDWPRLAQEPWARIEMAGDRKGLSPVGAPLEPYLHQPPAPADPPSGRLEVDFVNPPRPPRRKPRAESVRWRRRHEPPGQRPDPPLKVVFV